MLKFKVRYKFWQVLIGLISVGILFAIGHSLSSSGDNASTGLVEESLDPKPEPREGGGLRAFMLFVYMLCFFYFTLNYYYNLISNNKRFLEFVKITAFIVLISTLYHTFLYFNFPLGLQQEYNSLSSMYSVLWGTSIPMLIFTYLFAYVTVLRESLKQRRILEAQKLQLESQISQANFNFLKAQINPHFLHNTLNFLYAKSLPFSSELSEGILTLSDIMRYALNQGNQKEGKAPLKDEIEHVHNVIKISQLRYSNQLKVNFEVTGNVEGMTIIPFVLITIVENAFKHGDLKNPEYPIDIRLSVRGRQLIFYCKNKKKTGPKQLSTGIGLENIKKRLELAYGERYRYNVKEDFDFYSTELIIEEL